MDTSPEQEIADLDRELADVGEEVILQRITGVKLEDRVPYSVTVQAKVKAVGASDQLVTGINQSDVHLIISPTQIIAGAWPGVGSEGNEPYWVDRMLPERGDRVIVKGKNYKAEMVEAVSIRGTVVRINITTSGGAS